MLPVFQLQMRFSKVIGGGGMCKEQETGDIIKFDSRGKLKFVFMNCSDDDDNC